MTTKNDYDPEIVEAMRGLNPDLFKKPAVSKPTLQPSPFDSMTVQQRRKASQDGGFETQVRRHAFAAASWEQAKRLADLGKEWEQQWRMGVDTTVTMQRIREIVHPCFRGDGRLNVKTLEMLNKYASPPIYLLQDGESVRVQLCIESVPEFVVTYQG